MELNTIYQEPCLDTLAKMPDESINCVITSPPYWQLRDYGYEGQWGLESTFQLYLEHLWSMMDEIYRVLKPDGTCWINLGDTYSSSGGCGWTGLESENFKQKAQPHQVKDMPKKCLMLIPHRFAIGCIDRGWIVRNDIIWAKRNGMPESVTDRFSKKHEYFFFMVKSEKYHFDLDAIRDKHKQESLKRYEYEFGGNKLGIERDMIGTPHGKFNPTTKIPKENAEMYGSPRARQHRNIEGNMTENGLTRTTAGLSLKTAEEKMNILGKNPGSVSDFWDIPTKPSSSKHYASYNDSLLTKPVLAGCPEGGIIYDPFMGTGSTAEVALRTNRKFIGSEMSAEYCKISNKRLRKFTVESLF
jgi:DNA modification methylase